jgi:GNAT superfamily N-acetyltransferase
MSQKPQYTISQDKQLLDIGYIHAQLSASYWSSGIPRATVEKAIAGALCFGIYLGQQQVGFARLITDEATFAYLADVFVDEAHRGQGLSKMLLQYIMGLDFIPQLRRLSLATRDAHGLYAQFGFTPIAAPDRWMEIARPGIYLTLGEG